MGSGLRAPRLWNTGAMVVTRGFGCSKACVIFLDQGSNPCLLHWQVDTLPGKPLPWFSLSHQRAFSLTRTYKHTCTHTHTHTECSFLHLCFISIACPVQNAPPSCLLASLSHSWYKTSSCPSYSEHLWSVPPSEAAMTDVTCQAVDSGWFSSGRVESLLKAASDSEMARPALASRPGPSRV